MEQPSSPEKKRSTKAQGGARGKGQDKEKIILENKDFEIRKLKDGNIEVAGKNGELLARKLLSGIWEDFPVEEKEGETLNSTKIREVEEELNAEKENAREIAEKIKKKKEKLWQKAKKAKFSKPTTTPPAPKVKEEPKETPPTPEPVTEPVTDKTEEVEQKTEMKPEELKKDKEEAIERLREVIEKAKQTLEENRIERDKDKTLVETLRRELAEIIKTTTIEETKNDNSTELPENVVEIIDKTLQGLNNLKETYKEKNDNFFTDFNNNQIELLKSNPLLYFNGQMDSLKSMLDFARSEHERNPDYDYQTTEKWYTEQMEELQKIIDALKAKNPSK